MINYIEKSKNVFFIQIGANDGKYDPEKGYFDPLNPLINKYSLRGIIIEPQKSVFDNKLRKTYENNLNVILENIAIANYTRKKNLYKISFSSARWATGLASFSKKVIEKHIESGRVERKANEEGVKLPDRRTDYITSEDVYCMTFEDLIKKHKINRIDIILTDTEGYDYEIIKMINLDKYLPSIIIFEHKHLSRRDYKKCLDQLKIHNYKVRTKSGDTIAYQSFL